MTHHRFPTHNARKPRAGKLRRRRPQLEVLEDRTAPAVFVVNSLADGAPTQDNQLTLREAITAATTNMASGDAPAGETSADTIVFAQSILGGTINLDAGQGELTLDGGGDLSIVGPTSGSSSGITISGQNSSRVFNVTDAANAVNLMNLTAANGNAGVGFGGGVGNAGSNTILTSVTIRNSTAGFGGGLFNGGTITINRSRILDNQATANGGGLFNDNATGASMTVNDTYVARNRGIEGGGVFNFTQGRLVINRSTVAFNSSTSAGGGIRNVGTQANALALTNVTVASNNSDGGGGGGGVSSAAGTVTINDSTIVGNSDTSNNANGSGGVAKTGGTLAVANSIIAQNFAGPAVAAASENVNGGINTDNDNFIDGDPRLGPLQDNGGPTPTLAPLPGSPVIDAGSNGFLPAGVSTDQRGFPRILNNTVDQGAVEFFVGNTTLTLSVTQGGMAVTNTSTALPVTLTATVTSAAAGVTPTGSVNFYRDPTPTDPTDASVQLNSTPIALNDMGVATLPNVDLPSTGGLLARFVPSSPAFNPTTSQTQTITATIRDTVGVFDPNAVFQLLNQNTTTTTGPDFSYSFGLLGDQPVVGNWTGSASRVALPGVVRNVGGLLQWTLGDENPPVLPNLPDFSFGNAGQIALAGDWDGDGRTGIGVYDPNSGTFTLRNTPDAGPADFTFTFGGQSFLPVVGNWDGMGGDEVGVYNPGTGEWLLLASNTSGAPLFTPVFAFGGQSGALPVAGDWDGDGADGIGVFFPQTGANAGFGGFLLENAPGAGAPDVNGGNVILAGLANWLPVTGNWGVAPTTTNELLNLTGVGGQGGGQALDAGPLGLAVGAALGRLGVAGVDAGVLQALERAEFVVGDLPGAQLAAADAANGRVIVDADGAWLGWYIDPTPAEDGEFLSGDVAGYDLLTAVLHEMGHLAGHGHDEDGLMGEALATGVRHTDALDALFGTGQAAPDAGVIPLP